MFVTLGDASRPLRGDYLLKAEQRFSLDPIPSTLVLIVRADETVGQQLAHGAIVLAGTSQDRYRIVKVVRAPSLSSHGSAGVVEAMEVTALLDPVAALARPLSRAIVRSAGSSFADFYSACGSSAPVVGDVPIDKISCFVGQVPTFAVARAMHREATLPVWTANKELRFVRIMDMIGKPSQFIPAQVTKLVDSGFLEQHEIPSASSAMPDGSIVFGRVQSTPREIKFLPRTTPRVLRNMSSAMVVRRTAQVAFAGRIRAGDTFDVGGVLHAAVSVVHSWSSGSDGDAQQVTRMWLGTVST